MSGLEALGLACCIMQVISFGAEMASACKAVHEGIKPPDASLDRQAESLTAGTRSLDEYMERLSRSSTLSAEDREIQSLASRCSETAENLTAVFAQIGGKSATGSWRSSIKATGRRMWEKGNLDELEKDLNRYKSSMETNILVRICKKSDDISTLLSQQSSKLDHNLEAFLQKLAERQTEMWRKDQRTKLRESLRYPGMNERFNNIKEPHTATYDWVLEPERGCSSLRDHLNNACQLCEDSDEQDTWPDFTLWIKSDLKAWYWINGKPGSGKSTLVKYLVERSTTTTLLRDWRSDCQIISHFFWKPGNEMQNSVKGLWCSLAHQLLEMDDAMADLAMQGLPNASKKVEHHDWDTTQLEELTLKLLKRGPSAYGVFVDGLDEVNDRENSDHLIGALCKISDALGDRGKMCVSSRLEHRFTKHIDVSIQLELHRLTYHDMEAVVKDRLQGHLRAKYDASLFEHIKYTLLHKSEGVFIWLIIALESVVRGLQSGDSQDEIKFRIEQLPSDMSKLYRDMWNRLNGDESLYRKNAVAIFQYVERIQDARITGAAILLGLAPALEVVRGEYLVAEEERLTLLAEATKKVEVRCAGLVEVSRDGNLSFIHRTARDFWVENGVPGLQDVDAAARQDSMFSVLAAHVAVQAWFWRLESSSQPIRDRDMFETARLFEEALQGPSTTIVNKTVELFSAWRKTYWAALESLGEFKTSMLSSDMPYAITRPSQLFPFASEFLGNQWLAPLALQGLDTQEAALLLQMALGIACDFHKISCVSVIANYLRTGPHIEKHDRIICNSQPWSRTVTSLSVLELLAMRLFEEVSGFWHDFGLINDLIASILAMSPSYEDLHADAGLLITVYLDAHCINRTGTNHGHLSVGSAGVHSGPHYGPGYKRLTPDQLPYTADARSIITVKASISDLLGSVIAALKVHDASSGSIMYPELPQLINAYGEPDASAGNMHALYVSCEFRKWEGGLRTYPCCLYRIEPEHGKDILQCLEEGQTIEEGQRKLLKYSCEWAAQAWCHMVEQLQQLHKEGHAKMMNSHESCAVDQSLGNRAIELHQVESDAKGLAHSGLKG